MDEQEIMNLAPEEIKKLLPENEVPIRRLMVKRVADALNIVKLLDINTRIDFWEQVGAAIAELETSDETTIINVCTALTRGARQDTDQE